MPEIGADAAANSVGKAALSADVVKQAGRESAAEGFVEDANRVVVRIGAGRTQRDHADVRLVHIVFWNKVETRLGRIVLYVFFRKRRALRPGIECGPQTRFHGGRIEIARNSEND